MDLYSGDIETVEVILFNECMRHNWSRVIDLYSNERSWKAKITRAEDTVLHVAASSRVSLDVVHQLVERLPPAIVKDVLASTNGSGNTPLHLAAGLGLVEVCALLVEKSPELVVKARNLNRETPLFVAVLHGEKNAFFVLQASIPQQDLDGDIISYCRRGDGNTILHSAVYGEYLGMHAFFSPACLLNHTVLKPLYTVTNLISSFDLDLSKT